MKVHHLHNQRVPGAILNSVDPENFVPMRFTAKALNDDSCWEECESDFEESLPDYMLNSIDDGDF